MPEETPVFTQLVYQLCLLLWQIKSINTSEHLVFGEH